MDGRKTCEVLNQQTADLFRAQNRTHKPQQQRPESLEVPQGRLYTCCYTVTTRMTPALRIRWAAVRVILMFHYYEEQSHKTVSTNHNLFEEKGESKRYGTKVLLLTSLTASPNQLMRLNFFVNSFLSSIRPPFAIPSALHH